MTQQLTAPGQNRDSSPAMVASDSDSVFFLSSRNGGPTNVWVASLDHLQPEYQLTSFPISIDNLIVTPSYLVFTAEVWSDCGTDFACSAERDAWWEANPNSGIVFDKLFVRHWDTIVMPGKSSQLFTIQITRGAIYMTQSAPYQVTATLPPMNVPVPPDGGVEQLAVNPTYTRIAFTAAFNDQKTAWSTGWVIFEAQIDSSTGSLSSDTTPTCITCAKFSGIRTTQPSYDPTGRYFAFLAMDRPGFEADRLHLEVTVISSGLPSSPVALGWDRSIAEFTWTANSDIMAAVDEDGEHRVYKIDPVLGTLKPVLMSGTNSGLQVSRGNRLYFSHSSYSEPSDLYYYDVQAGGSNPTTQTTRVSKLNPTFPSSVFDPGTKFYYPSEDGSQVQGWFFKPLGWTPGRKYPFVLIIHGGPQGAWTSGWSYRWNPQLWAQHGYAAAMINPHGSTGFGQAYCDAVSGHWGGIPFRDLMKGVDRILSTNTWIDSKRLSACGASYGGFMINWIQGNAPNRFSSLVVHDGLFDIPISYGSTDELWFPEWEFKGVPWENPSGYSQWNPAAFTQNWKTPMLVVHGGKDYRVDLAQGLAAFTTLQRKSIPSKFLYYPLENHWVTKPTNSIQWYKEVLSWLDTHTANKTTTVTP